jgi:eukaryotic-like serine/threonine-protein kinase
MTDTATKTTWVPTRYQILRLLCETGMSTVWLAHDGKTGQPVVIKALLPDWADDTDKVTRFHNEITWTSRLGGRHLPLVFDVLDDPPHLGFVMEYVGANNLKQVLNGDPCNLAQGVRWMRDMFNCLAYVHIHDLAHGDIKPHNFVLGKRKRLHLIDLGIARHLGILNDLAPDGLITATARYVAPEQALGIEGGVCSDIYSLGVVLWEMFAGRELFNEGNLLDANTSVAIALKHIREAPTDIRLVRPEVYQWVADLIHWCLQKDKADRPQSIFTLISMAERRPQRYR